MSADATAINGPALATTVSAITDLFLHGSLREIRFDAAEASFADEISLRQAELLRDVAISR